MRACDTFEELTPPTGSIFLYFDVFFWVGVSMPYIAMYFLFLNWLRKTRLFIRTYYGIKHL